MPFPGLWQAPARVGEALKGGRLIAAVMRRAGYTVVPVDCVQVRPSFITAVQLNSSSAMEAFCSAVQKCSPVGSYILPEAGALPLPQAPVLLGALRGSTLQVIHVQQHAASHVAHAFRADTWVRRPHHLCGWHVHRWQHLRGVFGWAHPSSLCRLLPRGRSLDAVGSCPVCCPALHFQWRPHRLMSACMLVAACCTC
jgi:cystathionine beta-lyase family protein involved in aluminum resistance